MSGARRNKSPYFRYSRCCVSYRPKPRGHELPFSADFYPEVANWDDSIPLQISAESGTVAGSAAYTAYFRHLHLADNFLPPWGSSATVTKKLMSTPFQGASGPSGRAGLGTALGQPTVGGNHAAPKPVLISLQQVPQEPISLQLRKLTVRLLADVFNLGLTNHSVAQAIC